MSQSLVSTAADPQVLPAVTKPPPDNASPRRRAATDFAAVLTSVQQAGLMGRRYRYYATKVGLLTAALTGIWVGFAFIGDSWAQIGLAVALAVVLTQVLFLSHDAAHRQIFRSAAANEVTALVLGTAIGGVSLAWWNNKHARHHASPNQIGKDPDIEPTIVHFYPVEKVSSWPLARFLHERQGWWFFPLLLVEAVNLHVQSVIALRRRTVTKRRTLELWLITVRLAGYVAVLFVFLSPAIAATFLAVQVAVTGLYLGSVFSASHIGMPTLERGARIDFFRRQVLMSRNILGGRTASLLMGGLNYQIEHHLFPSMPRPNLARARPIVQSFCADHDVTYDEMKIHQAWTIVVRYLNEVGLAGRYAYQCPMAATLR